VTHFDTKDVERLIEFMHEEQVDAYDERESWFKATGDMLRTLTAELGFAADELEILRNVAKAASTHTKAIDHGFASEIRPDIARAELNHWLAEYGGWSSMATVHDGHES